MGQLKLTFSFCHVSPATRATVGPTGHKRTPEAAPACESLTHGRERYGEDPATEREQYMPCKQSHSCDAKTLRIEAHSIAADIIDEPLQRL